MIGVSDEQPEATTAPIRARRRMGWVVASLIAVLAVGGTVIGFQIGKSTTQTSLTAELNETHDELHKASEELESARAELSSYSSAAEAASSSVTDTPAPLLLKQLADRTFSGLDASDGVHVSGTDEAVTIRLEPYGIKHHIASLMAFVDEAGFSDSLLQKMDGTTEADGRLVDENRNGTCHVTWRYQSLQGLTMIFERE